MLTSILFLSPEVILQFCALVLSEGLYPEKVPSAAAVLIIVVVIVVAVIHRE